MVIRYHNLHQGTCISYSLSCFSCFPLISPKKKNIPSKAHAKSFDNWYCQLSSYALKGIVWGLWDSGTPRIQSTRFYQRDRRSVELSQSESPQHFHRTANVQRPLLSLFCQNQTRHSTPACFTLIWAVPSEKQEWLEIMPQGVTSITGRLSGASGWMLVAERLPVEYFRYIELSVSRNMLGKWWRHCQWPEWWTQFFWSFPRLL